MRRREFVGVLMSSLALSAGAARGQQPRHIPVVGVLWHAANAQEEREYLSVLIDEFAQLGYVDGTNITFLHKFPAEDSARFRRLAGELVESKPDVIIAVTSAGAMALREILSVIPVVFVIEPDPIGNGLVASLARPGGHMTGLSIVTNDLSGKRMALLREAVPNLTSVALVNSKDVATSRVTLAHAKAAKDLGVSLREIEIPQPDAIEQAFAELEHEGVQAAIVNGSMLFNERARLGASALAHKIPTLSAIAEMVPYGLLMSYGQDFPDYFRRAAAYVVRIIRGANPADLPVEQPTRFKQVINLKAAKLLGLTIPQTLLVTTDEVIE
ncbi:ABC transporter substrate-binding protein [Bradyrhizobium sp. McL0616]|uniref:ABC transporter substrate-binding protein n=1 Tax=Bradyrhizobium sp. McL0616 TaxID=3415674 RepID=UPI003CF62D7C